MTGIPIPSTVKSFSHSTAKRKKIQISKTDFRPIKTDTRKTATSRKLLPKKRNGKRETTNGNRIRESTKAGNITTAVSGGIGIGESLPPTRPETTTAVQPGHAKTRAGQDGDTSVPRNGITFLTGIPLPGPTLQSSHRK